MIERYLTEFEIVLYGVRQALRGKAESIHEKTLYIGIFAERVQTFIIRFPERIPKLLSAYTQ